MSAPNLEFLRSFPAFTVVGQEGSRIRVKAALKKPRTVSGMDDYGAAAYVAGLVDGSDGKEEAVYAFLLHEEGTRLLPGAPCPLKAATVEGIWTDHTRTIGFSLWECTVEEEPNQPPQRNAGSRPSSADSSASETPSSLGPRG